MRSICGYCYNMEKINGDWISRYDIKQEYASHGICPDYQEIEIMKLIKIGHHH